MRRWTCLLIVLMVPLVAGLAHSQTSPKEPTPPAAQGAPGTAISPTASASAIANLAYVGEDAPDFELDASDGTKVRLSKLKGYQVLLLFSDTRKDFLPLAAIEADLRKVGVKPYGICRDRSGSLESFAAKENFPFTLLSDPTQEISQIYGLHDRVHNSIRPGVALVDRQGHILLILLGQSLPPEEVLHLVQANVVAPE